MDAPLQLLPGWLMPDDQAGDWYQWTVVAAGHVMLGVAGFALLRLVLAPPLAWTICLTLYLGIEALQFVVGGGLLDGMTDALFVGSGMAIAWDSMRTDPRRFGLMIALLTLAIVVGVLIRS